MSHATRPDGPAYLYRATCHRVVDGDTYELTVDLGFRVLARLMVRLRDYACPELREEGGLSAKADAETLLMGRRLLVRSYKDQQSFARWVADVWVWDAGDPGAWASVGEVLVARGCAKHV